MTAHKLKGSGFFIGEGFSVRVCTERKHLSEYARNGNERFQLKYNAPIIRNKTFVYDHADQCVKECGI